VETVESGAPAEQADTPELAALLARVQDAVARAQDLRSQIRERADEFSVTTRVRAAEVRAASARLREERQHYRNMVDELRDLVDNLQKALGSRAGIEQAKGIIMAVEHCTPDEAFDRLREISQRSNRKLVVVAADVVARAQRRTDQSA